MKALVTGSEGFIGKNLCARLEKEGHEVIRYDTKIDRPAEGYWVEQEDFDVCYHLACVNQMQATKLPTENLEVNAMLTRDLVLEAKKRNAKFVYTSTASVYGNARHIPTPKEAFVHPITDYGIAKLAGEFYVRNSGADYQIYRLSNVYGPHQTLDNPYCGVIGRFMQAALDEKPFQIIGDGLQTRDFTYVADVIDVLVRHEPLIGDSRIQNLSHGKETSILELAMLISRLLGTKTEIEWIDRRVIDGIDRRCLAGELYCPTPLKRGILLTAQWWKNGVKDV